jgi:Tc5 transposase DNA-binding domain
MGTNEQNLPNALIGLTDGTFSSFRKASRTTRIPRTTLTRRYKGGLSRHEAQVNRQALSPEEEHALAKWVERLSCTGHPVHHPFICELADEIRKPRLELEGSGINPLGKHWVSCFLTCHPSLQSRIVKSIESARKDIMEKQLQKWFMTFKCIIDEYGISPENIYNIDETG